MPGLSKRELLRLLEQERKAHRAELANLLDRLAAANGRPWTPAPADTHDADADDDVVPAAWTFTPEQEPLV